MEDAIVTKLRRELSSRGPLTEARVVYILAEIRKLMERKRQQKKYYALSFHCSWALHPTMDRGGAGRILRRFDKAFELLKDKRLHELPANLRDEINATIGLEKFQDELKTFLVAHQFPTRIVEKEWTKFLRQYAAVIEDCALTLRDKSLGLQYIKKVTVHKDDGRKKIQGAGEQFKLFRIRWVSHGKNNKTATIETYYTIP